MGSNHLPTPKNTKGRRLVIPDIHGCIKTFQKLVTRLSLTRHDQLFLLGDYINRGPDSKGVLDYIIAQLENGFQFFALRGNHEQMALDSHQRRIDDPSLSKVPRLQKRKGIVNSDGKLLTKYYDFFTSLPYYYELDTCYLVHAGFNFTREDPFSDLESMLWVTDYQVIPSKIKNKRIIHGHVTKPYESIERNIAKRQMVIGLDNGCYKVSPTYEGQFGNLCCLDLDTFELMTQKNCENE